MKSATDWVNEHSQSGAFDLIHSVEDAVDLVMDIQADASSKKQESKLKHYIVIGRVRDDIEDSCRMFHCETRDDAVRAFWAKMREEFEEELEPSDDPDYDHEVLVTGVLRSESPVEIYEWV